MNNNTLKQSLLDFINEQNINLISYRELNICSLNNSDFEIVIRSNKKALHTITLNYHLKILKTELNINDSNLSKTTFDQVGAIIDFCNSKRREIGY